MEIYKLNLNALNKMEYFKQKIKYHKDNPIVRFLDNKGNTIRIEDGVIESKYANVIHKTHYWNIFDKDTIKEIESLLKVKAILS